MDIIKMSKQEELHNLIMKSLTLDEKIAIYKKYGWDEHRDDGKCEVDKIPVYYVRDPRMNGYSNMDWFMLESEYDGGKIILYQKPWVEFMPYQKRAMFAELKEKVAEMERMREVRKCADEEHEKILNRMLEDAYVAPIEE